MRRDSPQASRSRHCRAGTPILSPLIPGCSVAGDQDPSRSPVRGPDVAEASGMQARRTDAATFRAAPSGKTDSGGGWLRVHSSDPACCFCAVWAPAGRGKWRSPCSDTLVLGILICRKECITYANTYALNGILTRDSSDVAMLLQRLSTFNSGPRGRPADSARLRFDDAWKRPALAFVQLRVAFDLKRCRRHAALTSHGINWRHAGPRERGGPGRRLRRQRGRARSRPLGIRTPVRANP